MFRRLKKKLGLKRLYPYLLRHQWITRASKDPRWSVPVLKKFIGHSLHSNTIAEYQHFGDDDLKEAQLRVNGIVPTEDERRPSRAPVRCPKCEQANEYDAEFCRSCETTLSQSGVADVAELLEANNKKIFEKVREMVEALVKERPAA